jgi:hypothetical protein
MFLFHIASFVYVFFNEVPYLLIYQVYTLVNANTFPASPGSLWDSCLVLFKLDAVVSDISTLAFSNLFVVFINEHCADGCLSLPCFLKKHTVVLPAGRGHGHFSSIIYLL